MKRILLLTTLLSLHIASSGQTDQPSDLWYFQLQGPVKSIVIKGKHLIKANFDRNGKILEMTQDGKQVTVHRNADGRIDSTSTATGRMDDHHNTKYRQRATDERGNWMARKTQQQEPYFIGTEYCETTYYDER